MAGSTGVCAHHCRVESHGVDGDEPDDHAFGEARGHYRPQQKLRWPVVLAAASLGNEGGAWTETTLAMTHGVSVGGAFIASDLEVHVGQALRLWLHPGAPHPPGAPEVLRMSAQVRWQNPTPAKGLPKGFGVQFRAMSAAEELTLHAYFSAHHKVV